MTGNTNRASLLNIALIEEKYGRSLVVSLAFHGLMILAVAVTGYLLPVQTIKIGGGPGSGIGSDIDTVGVVDELSGGAGMVKPSLTPQPPALEKAQKKPSKAIPLPGSTEPRKKKTNAAKTSKAPPKSNVIPTAPEPGSGGIAARSMGGSGHGLSIGTGSGEFGNHWYVRLVESRIGENWPRPVEGVRVEMVYSFYISDRGVIYEVKKEKSSGNVLMDQQAERAIQASSPLNPPPAELRGRRLKFVVQFIHPPND
jgi:TonB family protein